MLVIQSVAKFLINNSDKLRPRRPRVIPQVVFQRMSKVHKITMKDRLFWHRVLDLTLITRTRRHSEMRTGLRLEHFKHPPEIVNSSLGGPSFLEQQDNELSQ